MAYTNSSTPVSGRAGSKWYYSTGARTGSFVGFQWATNSRVGQTNPSWKTQTAQLIDASTPYLHTEHSLRNGPFLAESLWYDGNLRRNVTCDGVTYLTGALSPQGIPSRPLADDIALKRLKGRLARDQKTFKALVPLAEIRETRNLIKSTAEAAGGLLKALLQIKHGKVRDAASAAGDAWLQFSFAISPTIADTNDLINAIGSYLERTDFTGQYRGSFEEDWVTRTDYAGQPEPSTEGCNWIPYSPMRRHHYSVQYSAGVNFTPRSANSYSVAQHFGLEFGEIIPTAWELIPFSWLVDYFTTTGAFLEDVFSSDGGSTYYCNKSVKYTCESLQRHKCVSSYTPIWTVVSAAEAVSYSRSFTFQRTVLGQIPHRSMRVKTLDEIGVNSVKRLLNLTALLL